MSRFLKFLFFSCFFLASLPLLAQNVRIQFGDLKISQKDTFSITLIFPKEKKKEYQSFPYYSFPLIPDFPKSITRYVEDQQNNCFKIIQQYIPLKAGKFRIYPFVIRAGEKELHSEGTHVWVLPSEKPDKYSYPDGIEFEETNTDVLFLVAPNRKEVFAGESIEITASLLISEKNSSNFNFIDLFQQTSEIARIFSPPNSFLDEFSPGGLETPQLDTIVINGIHYRRIKFYESRFYPLSAGPLSFPSYNFRILKYYDGAANQTIYWKTEEVSFPSRAFTIKVKPLPDHPLKSQVPVGKFSLKEGLSHNYVKSGKHFTYRAIISGEGNLASITSPPLKENEAFDFYSPVLRQRVIKESKNIGGKILEFTIIPKEPGTYHLADYFKWVYFNPYEEKYDTLHSRMVVTVEGESQKDKEISSMDLGSFYELLSKESNKLRSQEKDESLKFFANMIILFMLGTTAILVFKRS